MYKIISNNKIIDVVDQPKFIRFLPTGHVTFTDKANAQGLVGSDDVTLFSYAPVIGRTTTVASIEKISESEFSRLSDLLNSSSPEEIKLAGARATKLEVLSSICKEKITEGFTVVLADGERYNFRLTAEDQLNLMLIENQIAAGERHFIYHATNQPCKIYEKEDMLKIMHAFRKHLQYHTTYYNVVKQYINSVTDIEAVNSFTYGTDISTFAKDDLLKQILRSGGVI